LASDGPVDRARARSGGRDLRHRQPSLPGSRSVPPPGGPTGRTLLVDAALVAFAVVFVAELGDKTQLVAMGLAARYPVRLVLAGVVSAYAITQGIAALVGGVLGAALPTRAIGVVSGLIFLGFGVW